MEAVAYLFLINATVKSRNEACRLNVKCVAYFEKSSNSDRPPSFDLLPVARGKAQRNHVFLSIFLAVPEAFYSGPESAEEFAFIHHI
jgi:hypothetical protein